MRVSSGCGVLAPISSFNVDDWLVSERTTIGIERSVPDVSPCARRTPSLGMSGEYRTEEGHGKVREQILVEDSDGEPSVCDV
jgi:hypothetical protein